MGSEDPAASAEARAADAAIRDVVLTLRGQHTYYLEILDNSPFLQELRSIEHEINDPNQRPPSTLLQIPLDEGREALSVNARDLTGLYVSGHGEHPTMNTSEGHLGGYISAFHTLSNELGAEHGDGATWTPRLWRWIRDELKIESVLDVGCGEGHAAGYFQQLDCRICGVDGSEQAFLDSVIPACHVQHDYTVGPYVPDETYDLVWSCEFVEHVEEFYMQNFLATFAAAKKYIFMTYAPPGALGWHHVNCREAEYWIEKIEGLGFRFHTELTASARRASEPGHFRDRGLVFARPDAQEG